MVERIKERIKKILEEIEEETKGRKIFPLIWELRLLWREDKKKFRKEFIGLTNTDYKKAITKLSKFLVFTEFKDKEQKEWEEFKKEKETEWLKEQKKGDSNPHTK